MKKNILKIVILLLLFPCVVDAKEVNIKHFSYGGSSYDEFYSVAATPDGGYVAVGNSNSTDLEGLTNKGDYDAIIVKFNKDGKVEWSKNYGGSNSDRFTDVIVTSEGEIYVVGLVKSKDVEGIESSESDSIIIKYSKTGDIIWQKNDGFEYMTFYENIKQVGKKEFILLGREMSESSILKIDEDGNFIWKKTCDKLDPRVNGPFRDLEITKNGEYIVWASGEGYYGVSSVPYYDSAIVKYDKDGNFYDLNYTSFNFIRDVEMIPSGGLLIIEEEMSGQIKIFILDENGELYKEKTDYKGYNWNAVSLPDDTYLIAGNFSTENDEKLTLKGGIDFYLMNIDKEGNVLWENNYGGTEMDGYNFITTGNNGEYLIVGYSKSREIIGDSANGERDGVISIFSYEYDVVTTEADNGKYEIKKNGNRGEIILDPKVGYELDKIEIFNSKNEKVAYYRVGNKIYFDLVDDVDVKVSFKKAFKNPNTSMIEQYIFILIFVIVSISFIINGLGTKKVN